MVAVWQMFMREQWEQAPFKAPENVDAGKKAEFTFGGLACEVKFTSATEGVVSCKGKEYPCRLMPVESANGDLVFQLGTNNWQRPKKDDPSVLEFAPGSGVLHEDHHKAYNERPGTKSYSIYPSRNQAQPPEGSDYRVFELDHDIPICESASPNSSKRWHSFSEEEFTAYSKRLEEEVYAFTKECEAKEGRNFTMFIAHHSFVNPLVCKRVIQRRVAEGLPKCPLYCFVHGTALKMYKWELGGTNPEEYPLRFHKMIMEEKLFDDLENGVNACFVISTDQKIVLNDVFPCFPSERVVVAPNGINLDKFRPRDKAITQVIVEQTREIVWPKSPPSEADCAKYTKCISFVGKAAEWKRQKALLMAAAVYEKEFPDCVTLCVGTGPDKEMKELTDLCEELNLQNTFILGPRGQDILSEIYTVSSLGVFPSFREPFGLVFVECMGCRCPVVGANSGGPKDFVTSDVGELMPEPPETNSIDTVPAGMATMAKSLEEVIRRALKEDWKTTKADACIKLVYDRFTVAAQVDKMLKDVAALP